MHLKNFAFGALLATLQPSQCILVGVLGQNGLIQSVLEINIGGENVNVDHDFGTINFETGFQTGAPESPPS